MKKLYEKPDVEYIEMQILDAITNAGTNTSFGVGEDDEEGEII